MRRQQRRPDDHDPSRRPTHGRHGPIIGGDAVRAPPDSEPSARSSTRPAAPSWSRSRPTAGRASCRSASSSTPARPVLYTPLDEKPKRDDDPLALARVRDIARRSAGQPSWSTAGTRTGRDSPGFAPRGRPTSWSDAVGPTEHAAAVAALRARYPQYASHRLEDRPLIRISARADHGLGSTSATWRTSRWTRGSSGSPTRGRAASTWRSTHSPTARSARGRCRDRRDRPRADAGRPTRSAATRSGRCVRWTMEIQGAERLSRDVRSPRWLDDAVGRAGPRPDRLHRRRYPGDAVHQEPAHPSTRAPARRVPRRPSRRHRRAGARDRVPRPRRTRASA